MSRFSSIHSSWRCRQIQREWLHLDILCQVARVSAERPEVNDAPPALHQQQLVEALHADGHRAFKHEMCSHVQVTKTFEAEIVWQYTMVQPAQRHSILPHRTLQEPAGKSRQKNCGAPRRCQWKAGGWCTPPCGRCPLCCAPPASLSPPPARPALDTDIYMKASAARHLFRAQPEDLMLGVK